MNHSLSTSNPIQGTFSLINNCIIGIKFSIEFKKQILVQDVNKYLYDAINVSYVTDNLTTYQTAPALWANVIEPSGFDGNGSINFYMSEPYNAAENYEDYTYTINCRGDS